MDTILIVEDEADIREPLADLLEGRGYGVVAVADGREALDRLEEGLLPCLIILDLMLPVMSGWEFRRQQLKDSRWSSIPTVVLSGIDNGRREAQRLQAIAFLSKPINFESLYKTVDRYC
jgi:CheY-like chemotaxis protein